MTGWVWYSGTLLEADRVAIPVTSLSLTQGLGAYETLRLVGGRAPLLSRHLQRLAATCAQMGLEGASQDWEKALAALSRVCGIPDARARITIGDGFQLATCDPLPSELASERREGIALWTSTATPARAELKSVSRFGLLDAERAAGGEVLLVSPAGAWLETSRASVFAWIDDALWTACPPQVLPGIARAGLLEVARAEGIDMVHAPPSPSPAPDTELPELFTTNAVRGLRPVRSLNGQPLPIRERTRRLQKLLDQWMGLGESVPPSPGASI